MQEQPSTGHPELVHGQVRPNRLRFGARSRSRAMIALWLALVASYLVTSALGQRAAATTTVSLMIGTVAVASGWLRGGIVLGAVLAGLCVYFSSSMQILLYAPPLAAFAFMGLFFFRTLAPGSEPLITRVARREHPDLPPDMQQYTRKLTWIWSLSFSGLLLVALALAFVLAVDVWARVVHVLGYAMPAALLLGEYAYRQFRFPDHQHGSLPVLVANIVKVTEEVLIAQDRTGANDNCRPGSPG